MSRYSAHEHTAKVRTRPRQPTNRDKGILARIYAPILEGDTRYYDYAAKAYSTNHRFPVGHRVHLYVRCKPTLNNGIPFVQLNHQSEITLIERPSLKRLRILFDGVHGGWIEIPLATFTSCLRRAQRAYGQDLPEFTTTSIEVTFVLTPHATHAKPCQ